MNSTFTSERFLGDDHHAGDGVLDLHGRSGLGGAGGGDGGGQNGQGGQSAHRCSPLDCV
jgi:hypothetical protein